MRFRKKLLVQPGFQTWFFFHFLVHTGTLLLLFGAGIYIWVRIVADTIFKLIGLISESSIRVIKMNVQMGWWLFIALTTVLIGLAVFKAFLFSRKIAGPIFAFSRHLNQCEKNGRLEKFNLRKGDLFVELVDQFNRVVESINAKEDKLKSLEASNLKPFGSKRLNKA